MQRLGRSDSNRLSAVTGYANSGIMVKASPVEEQELVVRKVNVYMKTCEMYECLILSYF